VQLPVPSIHKRLRRASALCIALMLPTRTSHAQVARVEHAATGTAPDIGRVSGAAIDSALRSLAATPEPNARDLPITGASRRSYQFVVLARRATGAAELHERWDDVVLVRSGTALLRTGRALVARKLREPGEWNGTDIGGARDQAVGPGDVLVIPAGIPHQWQPTGSAPFAYVVLKVRAEKRPGA
jgi:uncharacterized RmlC-like cupin family protein